ncbi:MAG: hypothetical protein M3291_05155 [Actinomycetota bacterium]|nr:hypothetical protein [Actinomycetota bacterium]
MRPETVGLFRPGAGPDAGGVGDAGPDAGEETAEGFNGLGKQDECLVEDEGAVEGEGEGSHRGELRAQR